jgi:hypothetical protein
VLVEHPFDAEYKLLAPDRATERTAALYRFAVTVPPGKSETLKVVTQRPVSEDAAVLTAGPPDILAYAGRKEVSVAIRQSLQEVVQRRQHVQDLEQQAADQEAQIKTIGEDQDRIRRNMEALDKASALYKRYVTELDDQETKLQSLRQEAQRLHAQAAVAQQDLQSFVDKLTVAE